MTTTRAASRRERVLSAFTALAVGDAVGMPTEFMTRGEIVSQFGAVDKLLFPAESKRHQNLPYASVTDDTEQNLYLYRLYRLSGRVDANETAQTLLRWAEETRAAEKGYIGPSSLAALTALQNGASITVSGRKGTTCGGVMRTPAAVLYAAHDSEQSLARDVGSCLICTHNTYEALESAGAYGFALHAAVNGESMETIVRAAYRGAKALALTAPEPGNAPSAAARIRVLYERAQVCSPNELLDELFYVYGAGLPSADVTAAAFALFFAAKEDVWKAICMGASLGGDTDTISALAGALSAAYAGKTNVPADVLAAVFSNNSILNGLPWEERA